MFPASPCGLDAELDPSDNWWNFEASITSGCMRAYDFALAPSRAGGRVPELDGRGEAERLSDNGDVVGPDHAGGQSAGEERQGRDQRAGRCDAAWSIGSVAGQIQISTATRHANRNLSASVRLSSTACGPSVTAASFTKGVVLVWSGKLAGHRDATAASRAASFVVGVERLCHGARDDEPRRRGRTWHRRGARLGRDPVAWRAAAEG